MYVHVYTVDVDWPVVQALRGRVFFLHKQFDTVRYEIS